MTAGCASAHGAPAPGPWRRVVLAELFTSQGCSSCPAADTFVRELPALGLGRDKVVPLTFHVDYWDGLGWKDPFAKPAFTARQEWYARLGALRSPDGEGGLSGLYTPQMVVDGRVHFSGRQRDVATRELARAAARTPPLALRPSVAMRGDGVDVTVDVAARPELDRRADWRVVVALVAKGERTRVAHGENAGETLDEAAVVQDLSAPEPLPEGAQGNVRVRLAKPRDLPWSNVALVVFAQSARTGEVGAAVEAAAR